jgi:hypothetical protein
MSTQAQVGRRTDHYSEGVDIVLLLCALNNVSGAPVREREPGAPRIVVMSPHRYAWRSIQSSGEISTGGEVGAVSVDSAALLSAWLDWLKSLQLQSFGRH